jgi:RNA polymerase sigma factor (sigma-70 family)
MVFGTLIRLTGAREHVDDLAQEVFLRLYRALPAFRGESLLSTYLYRIIANVAQDEWKRRRREDRSLVSFSEEESDWKDRLPHPDAEQQFAERSHSMQESFALSKPLLSSRSPRTSPPGSPGKCLRAQRQYSPLRATVIVPLWHA